MKHFDLHQIARSAMAQYGFDVRFSEDVVQEVEAFDEKLLLKEERRDVKDLRSLLWSSIDNADSLDLDQLEFCERGPGQEIMVKVAVADVDRFVSRQTKTDRAAGHNATSVYTGIEIFPMLPKRLSTDLTSLLPQQDRGAVVIEFSVLSDGSVRSGDIYRALVRNKAKLVYQEIGEWLEGKRAEPAAVSGVTGLEDQLRLQDEAAQRLRAFRTERGALELGAIEANIVILEETVADVVLSRDNRAQRLIENFMIAANGTMARFLEKAARPIVERVVRSPKNWSGIAALAAACGESLPPEPDQKALSQFLAKRKEADPDRFPDLSLAIVKLLGPGEYVVLMPGGAPTGHFGLAVSDYTHATAPNRRYVDIIIQRLLKSVLDKETCPYAEAELAEFAAQCTDREKAAKKVERFMIKVAAAVLLEGRVGEVFDAIVTGASEKGTYARITAPPAEGRVMRGEAGMAIGQKVRVRLIGMDPTKGFIDFERVS